MAIRKKGSRKIIVDDHEFRWLASGHEYGIHVMIWSVRNENAIVKSHINYHPSKDGKVLAVTNRIIRAIILHAGIEKILKSSSQIDVGNIEDIVPIENATWQERPKKGMCPRCSERLGYETSCQAG